MPSVGVIAIGSLYWDCCPNRLAWRREWLDMSKAVRVALPIRYGRRSASRGDTFTMVFSRPCLRSDYGLGIGVAIPFKREITSPSDLLEAAEALWTAERNQKHANGKLGASWGCVGLLPNPRSRTTAEYVKAWKERVAADAGYPTLSHTKSERRAVDPVSGLLDIPWPSESGGGSVVPWDLLLGTATNPTLEGVPQRYPTAREIATAWVEDSQGFVEYFRENCASGISTFQDRFIASVLETHGVGCT